MTQDFKITTPAVILEASTGIEINVPFGTDILLVGRKNLVRWPGDYPFYLESILDVQKELASLPETSGEGAKPLRRLSNTECLDGVSFQIASDGETIHASTSHHSVPLRRPK